MRMDKFSHTRRMRFQNTTCAKEMATAAHLRGLRESVWLEQAKYEQAEGKYHEVLARSRGRLGCQGAALRSGSSGVIEATMTMIQQSLLANPETGHRADLEKRVVAVENENTQLRKELVGLKGRVAALEGRLGAPVTDESQKTADEEDFDLFGDEGDEEEEKAVPQPKPTKPKKPPVVAKSTIVLDVKPWDTETDMKEVEQLVRGITTDGLLWGASKLVDVAFGIKKLQIACVVEDEKVGIDFLEEGITAFEDHVQSVDVVAFNKI